MLDRIRTAVPATRSMSDARLGTLLAVAAVLFIAVADFDGGTWLLLAAAAGAYYVYRRRTPSTATIQVKRARSLETAAFEVPVPSERTGLTRTSSDPLVARAQALLVRVQAKS